jgi:hypothetical protein
MMFPAEMRVDYVRVYQRDGETNVGCSPDGFPTEEYINNHMDSYMSAFLFFLFRFFGDFRQLFRSLVVGCRWADVRHIYRS